MSDLSEALNDFEHAAIKLEHFRYEEDVIAEVAATRAILEGMFGKLETANQKLRADAFSPEEAAALLDVLYTLNPQIPGMEQSIDRKLRSLSSLRSSSLGEQK